jgi:hypothetical protein
MWWCICLCTAVFLLLVGHLFGVAKAEPPAVINGGRKKMGAATAIGADACCVGLSRSFQSSATGSGGGPNKTVSNAFAALCLESVSSATLYFLVRPGVARSSKFVVSSMDKKSILHGLPACLAPATW